MVKQTWDNYYREYYYMNKERIKDISREAKRKANKKYYEKKKKEREELKKVEDETKDGVGE